MNAITCSAGQIRASWATIQEDVSNGSAVVVKRHQRSTAVLLPPEWEGVATSDVWQRAMEVARAKYPGRSDYQLATEIVQKWTFQQDNAGSKDAKLDRILDVVLWIAKKIGYV